MRANLKVKIHAGAQGNILAVRMFKKMFPGKDDSVDFPRKNTIKNRHLTLTAYNGTKIPRYGAI